MRKTTRYELAGNGTRKVDDATDFGNGTRAWELLTRHVFTFIFGFLPVITGRTSRDRKYYRLLRKINRPNSHMFVSAKSSEITLASGLMKSQT